jgi:hypothetical protein
MLKSHLGKHVGLPEAVSNHFCWKRLSVMSQFYAFEPIRLPAGEEVCNAWPEVREARTMYEAQKLGLRNLVERALRSPSGAETHSLSQEIAVLLHNLSGTAAHFGEGAFGLCVGELEQPVRGAFSADLLRPFGEQIQAALNREKAD